MDYRQLKSHMESYYALYEKGLKKQANQYIDYLVRELEKEDNARKSAVLYHFTHDFCEEGGYEYLKERGNGRLPFAFDQSLREWLYERCLENRMPELRWFYELYCHDKIGYKFALEFLQRAYGSTECDSKTVNLLFMEYLEVLGWGAHHFPDGCIISEDARADAFDRCRMILSEREVDDRLQAQLKYFEVLYACYDDYVSDKRSRAFSGYCERAGLSFYEAKAYYFK